MRYFAEVVEITTYDEVYGAVINNKPILGRTHYIDHRKDEIEVVSEYPVSIINVRHKHQVWQVDAGPVKLPFLQLKKSWRFQYSDRPSSFIIDGVTPNTLCNYRSFKRELTTPLYTTPIPNHWMHGTNCLSSMLFKEILIKRSPIPRVYFSYVKLFYIIIYMKKHAGDRPLHLLTLDYII